jgi:hypothetical protein
MPKGVLWPHEYAEARDRHRVGATFKDLMEQYDVGYRGVRRHIRGLCNCGHDRPPVEPVPSGMEPHLRIRD